MARLGRYFVADQLLHVIQRGRDRQDIFFEDENYVRYRDCFSVVDFTLTSIIRISVGKSRREAKPDLIDSDPVFSNVGTLCSRCL